MLILNHRSAPLEVVIAVYFLWQEVGIASLAGLAFLLLLIPVNVYLVKRFRSLQIKQMKDKDERLKVMNEILTGIRVLKLYAWELSFEKIVEKIRLKEIATLLKAAYLSAFSQFIWNCAPFAVRLLTLCLLIINYYLYLGCFRYFWCICPARRKQRSGPF